MILGLTIQDILLLLDSHKRQRKSEQKMTALSYFRLRELTYGTHNWDHCLEINVGVAISKGYLRQPRSTRSLSVDSKLYSFLFSISSMGINNKRVSCLLSILGSTEYLVTCGNRVTSNKRVLLLLLLFNT